MSKTTTDPIADMLSRIRNAIAVRKHEVSMPHSNVKQAVAELLAKSKFVDSVKVEGEATTKSLNIVISNEGSNSRITEIQRVSTPGRRVYAKADAIPVVKRGRGIVIVSTSKGILIGSDAKQQGLGGEIICKVY